MLTHRITTGWSSGSSSIQKSFDVQAGSELSIDEVIPAASSDLALVFAADVSQIKSLFMVADAAVTIETNSGGSPVNTFTLAAGVPFLWTAGGAALRDTAGALVTTDITALYVTSTPGATLQIRLLSDPTV